MKTISGLCVLIALLCIQSLSIADESKEAVEEKAYLGIFAYKVNSPILRKQLKLDGKVGLIIAAVANESPAQTAGLQVHDILLAVGDTPLTGMDHLRTLIGSMRPGNSVALTVLSEGEETTLNAILSTRPKASNSGSGTRITETTKQVIVKRSSSSNRQPGLKLDIDLDKLITIAEDPDLPRKEKKKRVNALLTRGFLKGIRQISPSQTSGPGKSRLQEQVKRALAQLPPATQEHMRKHIYDKDGNIKDSVNVLETEKGPLIVVEEPGSNKSQEKE